MARSLRSRLERLERDAPPKEPELPGVVAMLRNGERIARMNGQWVDWPYDRPVAKCCKVYGFHPDHPEEEPDDCNPAQQGEQCPDSDD